MDAPPPKKRMRQVSLFGAVNPPLSAQPIPSSSIAATSLATDATTSSSADKKRQYMTDYLKYGFVQAAHDHSLPMCLLCNQTLSNEAMKPSKLQRHLHTKHSELSNKPVEYFKQLQLKYQKRTTITSSFTKQYSKQNQGLVASYHMSLLIAKSAKPHSVGERLIKPCISVFLREVLNYDDDSILRVMPLSNDVVRVRIDEMGANVEKQLVEKLRKREFVLQVDESTVRGSDAVLLAFVRYADENGLQEEMLFCERFLTTTTAADIYYLVTNYFADQNIPLTSLIACAADGAPAMMGRKNGFLKLMKDNNPQMMTVHCVIHRENLATKQMTPELHEIMLSVVRCVNAIKANPKSERLFAHFCQDLDKEHQLLIQHTEIRWLSKGNCLERFMELFKEIMEFLPPSDFSAPLRSDNGNCLAAYLCDIFQKLNVLNKELQGRQATLVLAKTKICSFISKLEMYSRQLEQGSFVNFPKLNKIATIPQTALDVVRKHIVSLRIEFEERFRDVCNIKFPEWLLRPLTADLFHVPHHLVDELADFRNDPLLANLCKDDDIMVWFNQRVNMLCPNAAKEAHHMLLPFPTTYLVESGFSVMNDILTKKRSRLDVTKRGDLRLRLTNLNPNIDELAKTHQAQGSH